MIADELRHRIEAGIITPGALIPTEAALTAEFRAARGTVRQAIAVLREEGLVITEHGRGTSAAPLPEKNDLARGEESEGRQREVAADPELAAIFDVAGGTCLIEEQSVRWRDGVVESVLRRYYLRP
ncbi:GntR family transcriptional regulator [Micromonospora sp. CA-248260]|uniref:GntR family transcriptional regulator n=1 Tax=Micromonospora sp. CA-248260 TaxID=3239962 RepID=UPI003D8ABE9B